MKTPISLFMYRADAISSPKCVPSLFLFFFDSSLPPLLHPLSFDLLAVSAALQNWGGAHGRESDRRERSASMRNNPVLSANETNLVLAFIVGSCNARCNFIQLHLKIDQPSVGRRGTSTRHKRISRFPAEGKKRKPRAICIIGRAYLSKRRVEMALDLRGNAEDNFTMGTRSNFRVTAKYFARVGFYP